VHAALRVVAERGVTAATTRAIVAEAGMSLASFHYAFSSRDELMAELIKYVVSQEEVAIFGGGEQQDLPAGGTIRDYVYAGLRGYVDLLHRDPLREKAMFELTQYALRSPGMTFLAQEQYDHYFALAASALEHAADMAGCEWDRPVEDVARLLVALTDGLTVAWLVNEDDTAATSIIEFAADAVAGLARTA
jgi:AcrR family transcriptional regulator